MTRRIETFDDYQRHLRNGYGKGDGKNYKPWLTIRDVKDKRSFRTLIYGLKTNREHHLLSSLEAQLFYLLDFKDNIIDIREQFPLVPLELSQSIAKTLDIKHPIISKTQIPNIMTTDMVATTCDNGKISYIAYCVKPLKKLKETRVQEKLEIERAWWEYLGIPFKIFTGTPQTSIVSRNIAWITDPLRTQTNMELLELVGKATTLLSLGKHLKIDICSSFMKAFDLDPNGALTLFRLLIAKRLIDIELNELIEESVSVTINQIRPSGYERCEH
jgi:hypothetical protein